MGILFLKLKVFFPADLLTPYAMLLLGLLYHSVCSESPSGIIM